MVSYPPICWWFHGQKRGRCLPWRSMRSSPPCAMISPRLKRTWRSPRRNWPWTPITRLAIAAIADSGGKMMGKWWVFAMVPTWKNTVKSHGEWRILHINFGSWLPYFQIAILDSIYNIPTVVSRCCHFWQHLGRFGIAIAKAINALNGRIDFTNKDLSATQESLHTTQNSLSDCFNEVGDGQTVMRKMWILMDSSLVLKKR